MNEINALEFWSDTATVDWWINEDARYRRAGSNEFSQNYLRVKMPKDVKSVLEVGAGTGRLIRMFKKAEAHAADINAGLCEYVSLKYPYVQTHHCPGHALDLPDNSVDMIYTFQMLQHVPNETIVQTLQELLRVTKDRLWLIEGYKPDKEQGERTHKANGGSFVYYYDKIFRCEDIESLDEGRIKVYKIRKKDNPSFIMNLGEK
jgi:ubiquinone/menaquinone biosynthesis C-methylase UbiE